MYAWGGGRGPRRPGLPEGRGPPGQPPCHGAGDQGRGQACTIPVQGFVPGRQVDPCGAEGPDLLYCFGLPFLLEVQLLEVRAPELVEKDEPDEVPAGVR